MNNASDDNYYSQEDIVKLMLENLISAFSLNEIGKNIINLGLKKEEEIIIQEKIPLSSLDILSIICKTIGSIKLMQCFLEVKTKMPERKNKDFKKKKKEKFIKSPEFKDKDIEKEKSKEKENEEKKSKEKEKVVGVEKVEEHKENDYTLYPKGNNNNPFELENNKIITDMIIEIEEGKQNSDDNNNNISNAVIDLKESDSSSSDIKEINYGGKSEIKLSKGKNKLSKDIENGKIEPKERIKSESKIFNPMKKFQLEKLYDISFHYYLHNECLFKFKLDSINKKDNIAQFSCDDPNCMATAEYHLINKIFTIKCSHSIPSHDHSYIKNLGDKELAVLDFMKKNNITDLQLKKR